MEARIQYGARQHAARGLADIVGAGRAIVSPRHPWVALAGGLAGRRRAPTIRFQEGGHPDASVVSGGPVFFLDPVLTDDRNFNCNNPLGQARSDRDRDA